MIQLYKYTQDTIQAKCPEEMVEELARMTCHMLYQHKYSPPLQVIMDQILPWLKELKKREMLEIYFNTISGQLHLQNLTAPIISKVDTVKNTYQMLPSDRISS